MQWSIVKYILPPKHIVLFLLIANHVYSLNAKNVVENIASDSASKDTKLLNSEYSMFNYQELQELVNLDKLHWEPPVSQLCWDHSIMYVKNLLNILLSDSTNDEPASNLSKLWPIESKLSLNENKC